MAHRTEVDDPVAPGPEVLLMGRLLVARGLPSDGNVAPRGLAARLLAMLAIEPGDGCSDDVLIDRIWMGVPPRNASFSLRNQIAGLRRLLGADAIVRVAGGYRLDRERCSTDFDRFDEYSRASHDAERAGDDNQALHLVESALSLVRGDILAEVGHEAWAVRFVEAADERVRAAEDHWASLTLRAGVTPEHLPRLRAMAEQSPHREHRWSALIEAHVTVGQRAEALRVAHDARRSLAAVGLRVGTAILQAEQSALSSPGALPSRRGLPLLLAARTVACVGRAFEIAAIRDGTVAIVEGAPSMGKTRLLAEVAWLADNEGVTVIHVKADGAADEATFIAALAGELVAAADRADVDPLLRPLLDGRERDGLPSDPATASALQRNALRRLVDELAEAGPLLFAFDDVHRLRSDDHRLVHELIRWAPEGVRFVFAGRGTGSSTSWWQAMLPPEPGLVRGGLVRVVVGPLARGDIESLAEIHLGDGDHGALVDAVWEAGEGHPLVSTRIIEEYRSTGDLDLDAGRWSPLLEHTLADIDEVPRHVLAVLALLERPVDEATLAIAASTPADTVSSALVELEHRHVVQREGLRVRASTDAFPAVARAAAPMVLRRTVHRALIDEPDVRRREPGLVFGLLIEEGVAHPGDAEALDEVYVAVAMDLVGAGAVVAALDATRRFLAAAGNGVATPASVAARLVASNVLLTSADTASTGIALLELVEARARALDDPRLIADAVLAHGPVDTGGRHARRTALEAESLATRLAADDVRRRVQLLCWAAHHRINVGEVDAAFELLDEADRAALGSTDPAWRALVLGVRAQGRLAALGSPDGALESLLELERWADLTGALTATGAARLLGISRAFGAGTLDDVETAIAALTSFSDTLPRPDLRWFPSAATVAVALARGDVSAARAATDEAVALGRTLGVSGAVPAAAVHHLLLALASGTLGALAAMIDAAAAGNAPGADRLAMHGLVCVQVGEIDRAREAADRLAARSALLAGTGASWPLVAMAAADLAFATDHAPLGEMVWRELRAWSGWGLNMNGIAYVGAADMWLGAAAAATGRRAVAAELIESGIAQDERRGALAWSARGSSLREALG